MTKKVPKIFKRAYTETRFEQIILRRVFIEEDRAFLIGLYQGQEGEPLRLKDGLSAEQIKRLRGLAKAIKKNRGVVSLGKVIVAAVVVLGIVLFNLLFKNQLLEAALESGLKSAFHAEAEVTRLNFSLFRGLVEFDHLVVANKDKPLKNLFELGPTEIRIDMGQLLKAKVIARSIACREVAWNTDRQEPGSAAGKAARSSGGGTGEPFAPALQPIDVESLLREQSKNLKSLELAGQIQTQIERAAEKWPAALDRTQGTFDALSETAKGITAIDVGSIRSPADIEAYRTRVDQALPALQTLENDVSSIRDGLKADIETIDALQARIQQSIEADFEYAKAFIDPQQGEWRGVVANLAADYVRGYIGEYYDYALKARDLVISLKNREKPPKKAGTKGRQGQDIPFPTKVYPKYMLEKMEASLAGENGALQIAAVLRDLSSNPDLLNKPTSFAMEQKQGKRRLSITGSVDARTRRDDDLTATFELEGYNLSLTEQVRPLGLKRVDGIYRLSADFVLGREGSARGRATLGIGSLVIEPEHESDSPIGSVLGGILGSLASLTVEMTYRVDPSGRVTIEADSNADELIAQGIEGYLGQITARYEAELRSELQSMIEGQLNNNAATYASFLDIDRAAGERLKDIDAVQGLLGRKKSALGGRLSSIQQEARQKLQQEAARAAEEIKDKVQDSVPDKVQVPKIRF